MIRYPQLRHEVKLRIRGLVADDYAAQLERGAQAAGLTVEHRFHDDLNDILEPFETDDGYDAAGAIGTVLKSEREAELVQSFIVALDAATEDSPSYATVRTLDDWPVVVKRGRDVLAELGEFD